MLARAALTNAAIAVSLAAAGAAAMSLYLDARGLRVCESVEDALRAREGAPGERVRCVERTWHALSRQPRSHIVREGARPIEAHWWLRDGSEERCTQDGDCALRTGACCEIDGLLAIHAHEFPSPPTDVECRRRMACLETPSVACVQGRCVASRPPPARAPYERPVVPIAPVEPPPPPRALPPPPPRPSPPAPPVVKETLSKVDILVVLKAKLPQIEECGRKHGASGKLTVAWRVELDGRTADVHADERTPVAACAEAVIRTWKFPKHTRPTPPIRFPFKLP